jgi:hypothetical protein
MPIVTLPRGSVVTFSCLSALTMVELEPKTNAVKG